MRSLQPHRSMSLLSRPAPWWAGRIGVVMVVLKWAIGVVVGRLILIPFAVVMVPVPPLSLTVIVESVAALPVTKVRSLLLDSNGGGLVTKVAVALPSTPGRSIVPRVPLESKLMVTLCAVASFTVKLTPPVVLVVIVWGDASPLIVAAPVVETCTLAI